MSDNEFALLFYLIVFVLLVLVVIAERLFKVVKILTLWHQSWSEEDDNRSFGRKDQTEAIESKLDDILRELSLPRLEKEFQEQSKEEMRKMLESARGSLPTIKPGQND